MHSPPLPANESARIEALLQCNILNTAPEEAFDDITSLAAHICKTPIALISLVDVERQWFKSKIGLEATETPRNISFCGYTILRSEVFIVPDALADERFADNPLVTDSPHIRFYAGAPLITPEGLNLGSLCVIDRVPRDLSAEQIEALQTLSRQVVKQIQLRQNLADLERTVIQRRQKRTKLSPFLKRIGLALGAASAIFIIISAASYHSITELAQTTVSVIEKQALVGKLDHVNLQLKDIEISQHRYVLSGDRKDLKLHDLTVETVQQEIKELGQVAGDSPNHQNEIDNINRLLANEIAEAETLITVRQEQGLEVALQRLFKNENQGTLKKIHEEVKQLKEQNLASMQGQRKRIETDVRNTIFQLLCEVLITLAILSLVFYWVYREVIKRYQTEMILEQERDFIAAVLDTVDALVIVLDYQGKIIRFNRNCEETTGYSFDEVRHKRFWDIFLLTEELEQVKGTFSNLKSGQFPNAHENFWITKEGEHRLIAWSNTALLDSEGAVEYIIGTGIDVTEDRRVKSELHRSEVTNRALVQAIPDLMIRMNRDGFYLDFIPPKDFQAIMPYDTMQGKNLFEIMPPEAAQQRMYYTEQALQTGKTQVYEFQLQIDDRVLTEEARIVISGEDEVLVIVRDISDRKRVEEALAQLAAIVESSEDAIIGTTLDGKILSWNSGAERTYGYSAEEVIGKSVMFLLTPSTDPDLPVQKSQGLQPQVYLNHSEVQHLRKDGHLIDVFLTMSPVKDVTGKIVGTSVIARDVTDRRAVERMKNEFISIVSHELRTPLTSLRGSLGLLLTGKMGMLSEKGNRMLEIAVNNTDRLVRLINDILDLESLESGKVASSKQLHNIENLIDQAVETMQAMADKAAIALEVSSVSTWCNVDSDRLLQVLTNLLSNAIKFSPPGSTVRLEAKLLSPQESGGKNQEENGSSDTLSSLTRTSSSCPTLLITVQDQGRGIPADKLEAIFERFQQVDASDTRQKGGTGLGLAICRAIVEQHNGKIGVESRLGEGSTFYLSLPVLASNEIKVLPSSGNERLILLCQNPLANSSIMKTMLEEQGYQVVTTTSAEEAIIQSVSLRPIAILLNLASPVMNEWHALATLRDQIGTQDIPLVVFDPLSSKGQSTPEKATDGLCQFVDQTSLFQVLKQAEEQRGQVGRVLIIEDDLDLASVLTAIFNYHGIQTAHAETERTAIELCQRFLPDLLVLDLSLSKGDGFAIVDWLRQQEHLCQLPVVVYTAGELDDAKRSHLKLRRTEFVIKSRIPPETLAQQIISLLKPALPND